MGGFGATTLLAILSLANAATWFAEYDLPQELKDEILEMGCYRGTYGLSENLSLFNCPSKDGIVPFVDAPLMAPLCVVELNPDGSQKDIVIDTIRTSTDCQILWTGKGELIVGPQNLLNKDYPSICSRSAFPIGSMRNAIVVPFAPTRKPIKESAPSSINAPDPKIQSFINGVSSSNLQSTVTTLSNYQTRLSTSTQANQSTSWIQSQFSSRGLTVTTNNFRAGYCPNVIATKAGTNPARFIYVGAHSDCRASNISSTTERAPGADDNAGSVAMLLEFARLLNSTNIKTEHSIVLITFCGEEQGLYGSQAQASADKSAGKNILGFYNSDMIGYKCAANTVLTFDSRSITSSLTETCRALAGEYVPGYSTGSNSGCCSDNQSYYNQGFPTVSFFECPGTTVANPNYHKSSDLPSTLDYNQLTVMSKLIMACALTQAVVQ